MGRGSKVARALSVVVAVTAAFAALPGNAPAQGATSYQETFRPQFHFTPERNWINDPNGLVYHDGEYHLFYQHNPFGDTWGHMSWGHAVSRDLVHWEHLPLAIPEMGDEMVFSGSAVVDHGNTSGLGTEATPPMVAIYTSHRPGNQSQSLAYSLDRGRTWTRYAGNPVLDIGSSEFRDPDVFWYEPDQVWIMSVALPIDRKIRFYSSPDLKRWTHLSDFGPAGAVDGIWECPDLFPLPVKGGADKEKWVLVVNLNPGGVAGGSAGQYFVGEFDGRRFVADDDGQYTPPEGEVFEDFEGADYGAWTTTGAAFGSGPARGTLPGQQTVSGFSGGGLVNSFIDFDRSQGTLTSPAFTIDRAYVNLLVGGGPHRHAPGSGDGSPPAGEVLADFEGPTFGDGWTATGDFDGAAPHRGGDGRIGEQIVDTFFGSGGRTGDPLTGRIISPTFEVTRDWLSFEIAGGPYRHPGPGATAVNLVVDDEVVRTASGNETGTLNWVAWDVSALRGRDARIEIVDEATGAWGHLLADHFVLGDEPAQVRSDETAVNLLVDGDVVRTASGRESERLDWVAWNVEDLIGREARIQIVDRNSGGWGHILADRITFADAPAQSSLERADWLDWGKDHYAAISWDGAPDGRRVMIGWMNNWQYANVIPTSPWRGAMGVPREVALERRAGRLELVQSPVPELDDLRTGAPFESRGEIREGTTPLSGAGASGRTLDIEAEFKTGSAERFGLEVLAGGDEKTVIGYDARSEEVFVDRRRSGDTEFSRAFADEVQRAPLQAKGGKVQLRILVDWSSVEVFADGGRRVITDQVFPSESSDGVRLFAEGGGATLRRLSIARLRSAWE